jgi:hypothetical protein
MVHLVPADVVDDDDLGMPGVPKGVRAVTDRPGGRSGEPPDPLRFSGCMSIGASLLELPMRARGQSGMATTDGT